MIPTMGNDVLVVADDPSAWGGLARLLRSAGHDVREAASADELLDALFPGKAGCLVLDAGIPGLLGGNLQAELEARDARMPVIVINAGDDPETRRKAEAMHAVGFFRKPVDGVALLDAVGWALERNRAR
jgi:FixJ family two-component response regulator